MDALTLLTQFLGGAMATPDPTYETVDPTTALQSGFFASPEYVALFGQNNAVDPVQRFKQDPSNQYNMDQALLAVNRATATKGLLESGQNQRDLLTTAQGLQNNYYQTWLGQQAQLYSDWQNRLSGLTNMGVDTNGANQAMQLGSLLGSTGSGYEFNTGSNIGQATMGAGNDIASLLANQGVFGGNAFLSTGAAQANALMSAFGMQQQMNNAAMQSQALQQSSLLQGQGAMMGAQALVGSGSTPLLPGRTY